MLNGPGGNDTHRRRRRRRHRRSIRDALSSYTVTATTDSHGRVTGFSQVHEEHRAAAHDDGTDALTSVERLTFSDATLDLTQKVQRRWAQTT